MPRFVVSCCMIIGSTAMKHWFPECREPKDLDIISKKKIMTEKEQHYYIPEFEALLDLNKESKYITPENLLTLKASHFGWNIHWDKTAYDIIFLKKKGFKINRELYTILHNGWKKIHGEKWAKLEKKNPDKFFDDAVKRIYNHDEIHEIVAVYDRPLYERILKEEGKVGCSQTKFNLLSDEDKTNLILEETWVTALERYLIPNNFEFSIQHAYHLSLSKLVKSMSSGWFKFEVIDRYHDIYKNKTNLWVEKFQQAVKTNKITKQNE